MEGTQAVDSQVDYIANIEEVAKKAASSKHQLHTTILIQWADVEKQAKDFFPPYDILNTTLIESSPVRQHMRNLMTTLYEVPGADPIQDCAVLRTKDAAYGGSWCRRGGQGAFMMLARKADRFETQLKKHRGNFMEALHDHEGESLNDTLADWRCYLILVESFHVSREAVCQLMLK